MSCLRFGCLLFFASFVAAQPPLQLKGLRGGRPSTSAEWAGHRKPGLRRHMVVQFKQQAAPQTLQLLKTRGASILEYVPQFGYVLSAPDGIYLNDLDLQWSGSLTAHEKLSPALSRNPANTSSFVVVEFYPDVGVADARTLILQAGLVLHDNPDLLDRDLLVSGPPRGLLSLARWDEVEYIFPASDDLIHGRKVNACPGALTDAGQVGQSVPKVGSWGPVGGSISLQYALVNLSGQLAPAAAEAEIVRAFSTWSKYVQVDWTETSDTTAAQTVAILFGRRAHGDAYPFDGPGGVLAHTFYPYPVSSEPVAGDMHFDDDENWHIGADTDLFSVALHETGHALGLGHSDDPGAVMYPYYHQVADLSQEDIGAIQGLYASRATSVPPDIPTPLTLSVTDPAPSTAASTLNLSGSTSGGVAPVAVSWTSDAGGSGIATGGSAWSIQNIPLHAGVNTITVTAIDAQRAALTHSLSITFTAPAQPLPSLQIASPVASGIYTSSSSTVVLAGTASDASGIAQVFWSTSSGTSGVAAGTTNWNTGPIQLSAATTRISITAQAADGLTAIESIQVNYTQPDPTTPTGGGGTGTANAAPSLTILTPAVTTLTVSTPTLSLAGTASSSAGIATVTWTNSDGNSGTASGTTQWSIPAIPLMIGTNTVVIRAFDTAGANAWRSLVITRTSN